MSLVLSSEQEALVREKVESGQYRSSDEVIDAALSPLDRTDRVHLDALHAALDEGEADLRNGRFTAIETEEELAEFFAGL